MDSWALVVGINLHPCDAGLAELYGAVADACDFAEWALHPDGGAVPPQRLFFWTTPAPDPAMIGPLLAAYLQAPTKWRAPRLIAMASPPDARRPPDAGEIRAVVRAMAETAVTATQPQRAYVHFAGHGVQLTANGVRETCFLAGDYARGGGLVPCGQMSRYLETNGFAQVIMFLDCCRTSIGGLEELPNLFRSGSGGRTLTGTGHAAEPEKVSFEFPLDLPKRGAFTRALTEGLRTHREPTGSLSFDGLGAFVRRRVEVLLGAKVQSPQFASDPPQPGTPLILVTGAPILEQQPIVVTFVNARPGAKVWLISEEGERPDPLIAGPAQTQAQVDAPIGKPYALRTDDNRMVKSFFHPGPGPTSVDL